MGWETPVREQQTEMNRHKRGEKGGKQRRGHTGREGGQEDRGMVGEVTQEKTQRPGVDNNGVHT